MKKLLLFTFALFSLGLTASEGGGGAAEGPNVFAQFVQDLVDHDEVTESVAALAEGFGEMSNSEQAQALVGFAGESNDSMRKEVAQLLIDNEGIVESSEKAGLLLSLCENCSGDEVPNLVDGWVNDEDVDLSDVERSSAKVRLYESRLQFLQGRLDELEERLEVIDGQVEGAAAVIDMPEDLEIRESDSAEVAFYKQSVQEKNALNDGEVQPLREIIDEVEAALDAAKEGLVAAKKAVSDAAWNDGRYFAWLTS